MKKHTISILCLMLAAIVGVSAGIRGETPSGANVYAEREQTALCATVAPTKPVATENSSMQAADEPQKSELPAEAQAKAVAANLEQTQGASELATINTTPTSANTSNNADPYHTDVYPENVYSEKYIYDADGNLIGKTTTIPCAFDESTVWIEGHAYYDIPGFGLIEWGGPNEVTEAYDMYENGNKVGIMGDEDGTSGGYAVPTAMPERVYYTAEDCTDGIPPMPTISSKPSVPDDYAPGTIAD